MIQLDENTMIDPLTVEIMQIDIVNPAIPLHRLTIATNNGQVAINHTEKTKLVEYMQLIQKAKVN